MKIYDFSKIEKKWQLFWDENKTFFCDINDFSKPKYYILDMFPYPSGKGLHVGHVKGYTASDIIARMKRMQGFNVLHPIGWDAFGLPAENFAIKNNIDPEIFTKENINNFKKQIKSLGFSYDWSKEINTSEPSYYKWTQWIFLKLFKYNLAYISNVPVNFCPELKTVLANEEVENGKSKDGNFPVIRMSIRQWMLKITKYADKLLDGLKKIDWPKSTINMQINWIGKSIGTTVIFDIENSKEKIKIFTTRVDTIFGCTYCVLAPEHPIIKKIVKNKQKKEKIKNFIKEISNKNDLERTDLNKNKKGFFIGCYAINPINNKKIPIYVADYVLMNYGEGAVMAVPAHDNRDYEFAKKYKLPIIKVLDGDISKNAFTEDSKHINSDFANGLYIEEAKKKINERLAFLKKGKIDIHYKLKDWIFSRQRYWGEPIPILIKKNKKLIPLKEKELPLKLPKIKVFGSTKNNKLPLDNADKKWLNVKLKNGEIAKRETNIMPQWAGSCWYYMRYIDPKNDKKICEKKILNYWLPVDLYIGGSEHAVLHLLYARFWHKFLYDLNIVNCDEPFKKLFHQGMILGKNNEKMSKSRGNVVNPDDIIAKYGADSLRLYEMFMGPLEDSIPWNENGLNGAKHFIERVWKIYTDEKMIKKWSKKNNNELDYIYHFTIKKITEDFKNLQFNTAISQMMIFVNEIYKSNSIYYEYIINFLKVFSCVCPFVSEEINEILGNKTSIINSKWPVYDDKKTILNDINIAITINGKFKMVIKINRNLSEKEIKNVVLNNENIKNKIDIEKIKKIIVVKNKIVNIVLI